MTRAIATALAACVLAVASGARADEAAEGPATSDAGEAPPPAPVTTYSAIASGGAAYHKLFGVPFDTGVASLGFGADLGHLALYVRGDYEGGRSDHGLALRVFRIGASAEGIVGRFRLGAGLDVSSVAFVRATDGSSVGRLGVGLFGVTSLDLVRFDGHALYLGVRGDADASAQMFGASLVLGFRL